MSLILPFTGSFKGANTKDKTFTQSEICKETNIY